MMINFKKAPGKQNPKGVYLWSGEITIYSSRTLEPASELLIFESPKLLFDQTLRGMHQYQGVNFKSKTEGRIGEFGKIIVTTDNEVLTIKYPNEK